MLWPPDRDRVHVGSAVEPGLQGGSGSAGVGDDSDSLLAEALRELRELREAAAGPVARDDGPAVEWTTPDGRSVRFAPAQRPGELTRFVHPAGAGAAAWARAAPVAALWYDPATQSVADQRGDAVALPSDGRWQALPALAALCDAAGVPHDLHDAAHPPPAPAPPVLQAFVPPPHTQCSGIYHLLPGRLVAGRPLWRRSGGLTMWLFTAPDSRWVISDSEADFETGVGYVAENERGAPSPDLVPLWSQGHNAGWRADPSVRVTSAGAGSRAGSPLRPAGRRLGGAAPAQPLRAPSPSPPALQPLHVSPPRSVRSADSGHAPVWDPAVQPEPLAATSRSPPPANWGDRSPERLPVPPSPPPSPPRARVLRTPSHSPPAASPAPAAQYAQGFSDEISALRAQLLVTQLAVAQLAAPENQVWRAGVPPQPVPVHAPPQPVPVHAPPQPVPVHVPPPPAPVPVQTLPPPQSEPPLAAAGAGLSPWRDGWPRPRRHLPQPPPALQVPIGLQLPLQADAGPPSVRSGSPTRADGSTGAASRRQQSPQRHSCGSPADASGPASPATRDTTPIVVAGGIRYAAPLHSRRGRTVPSFRLGPTAGLR